MRSAAVLLCLVLFCVACSDGTSGDGPAADADGTSDRFAAGDLARVSTHGVTVTVPSGSTSDGGTLSVRPGDAPAEVPGVAEVTSAINVELEGARLTSPAQVEFPVPKSWGQRGLTPVALWQEPDGSWRWLETRMSADGRQAVARTPHFSSGVLGGFDPTAAARDLARKLAAEAVGRSGAPNPRCAGEAEARTTVRVSSDGGDSIRWCLGRENGETVLKITNNRTVYTQIGYPARWLNRGLRPTIGFSLTRLFEDSALGLELALAPAGREVFLIAPGATATLVVPDRATDRVSAKASPAAYLLQVLRFAGDLVSTLSARAGLAKAVTPFDRMFAALGEGKGDRAAWTEAATSCLQTFTESFTTTMFEPVENADQVARVTDFALRCGADLGRASLRESGPLAWLTSGTVSAVLAVYGLVTTARTLVTTTLREVYDSLASLGGAVDDASYDILVSTTDEVPPHLVGTYTVHGGTLEVGADGTATSTDYYCSVPDWVSGCKNVLELDVTTTGEGSLRLEVTADYAERDGERRADADGLVQVGDYYTLTPREPGFYLTRLFAADGTPKTATDEANNLGNPWLCRTDLAEDQTLVQRCGA